MPVQWDKLRSQLGVGKEPPLFADLMREADKGTWTSKKDIPRIDLRKQLEEVPAGDRPHILTNFVREQVAKVLGLDLNDTLNPDQPLSRMGLDSMMAIELKNRVQNYLGLELAVARFLDAPSVTDLVTLLMSRLGESEAGQPQDKAPLVPVQDGTAESWEEGAV